MTIISRLLAGIFAAAVLLSAIGVLACGSGQRAESGGWSGRDAEDPAV